MGKKTFRDGKKSRKPAGGEKNPTPYQKDKRIADEEAINHRRPHSLDARYGTMTD
jgi:hypothetical protein